MPDTTTDSPIVMHILRADGSMSFHMFEWPEEPGYDRIDALIKPILDEDRSGAEIEHVTYLGDDGERADMFVDEMGALAHLPRNELATHFYRRAALAADPRLDPEQLPAIYGTACLFSRRVWF